MSAKCPSDKDQIIYWDHPKSLDGKLHNNSQTGLGFRITANGSKSFVHTYFFNGKRKRQAIGKTSVMSINSARLLVQDREGKITSGIDPSESETDYRKKHSITVSELIEQYDAHHLSKLSHRHRTEFARLIAPWLHEREVDSLYYRRKNKPAFTAFTVKFGNKPAEEIIPTNIAEFIDGIASDSISNKALSNLKSLYNWGIRMQLIDIRNPCSPFNKRKIIRRKPEYSPSDIAAIAGHIFNPCFEVLEHQPETSTVEKKKAALASGRLHQNNMQMLELCHFMGILFLTMARPSDLKNAKFKHFDLKQLIWHKHNTKGLKLSKSSYEYKSRSVPIHPRVAEIIKKQQQQWPDASFVFPSHMDQSKPRNNFHKVLQRFKKLKGVPEHFQMYDVKRIAISLMITGQGVRREDVSHYVDHKGNLDTTLIYDLGFVEPMRPVTQKLGDLLGV